MRKQPKWYSESAGPINNFDDSLVVNIFSFIPNFGRKELNFLLRTSKRINNLASSDWFWSLINLSDSQKWINSVWYGESREGTESDEWNRIREDSGLPIMNMLK